MHTTIINKKVNQTHLKVRGKQEKLTGLKQEMNEEKITVENTTEQLRRVGEDQSAN